MRTLLDIKSHLIPGLEGISKHFGALNWLSLGFASKCSKYSLRELFIFLLMRRYLLHLGNFLCSGFWICVLQTLQFRKLFLLFFFSCNFPIFLRFNFALPSVFCFLQFLHRSPLCRWELEIPGKSAVPGSWTAPASSPPPPSLSDPPALGWRRE